MGHFTTTKLQTKCIKDASFNKILIRPFLFGPNVHFNFATQRISIRIRLHNLRPHPSSSSSGPIQGIQSSAVVITYYYRTYYCPTTRIIIICGMRLFKVVPGTDCRAIRYYDNPEGPRHHLPTLYDHAYPLNCNGEFIKWNILCCRCKTQGLYAYLGISRIYYNGPRCLPMIKYCYYIHNSNRYNWKLWGRGNSDQMGEGGFFRTIKILRDWSKQPQKLYRRHFQII